MIRVSIVGCSGYTGGELLRLLLIHSECTVQQITSERDSSIASGRSMVSSRGWEDELVRLFCRSLAARLRHREVSIGA